MGSLRGRIEVCGGVCIGDGDFFETSCDRKLMVIQVVVSCHLCW